MRRLLQPFVLIVTAILGLGYAYVASRLASEVWLRAVLAVPFVMVWVVPVIYWSRDRNERGRFDDVARIASYLSMAWLSFLFVLTLGWDLARLATAAWGPLFPVHQFLRQSGVPLVYAGSVVALALGVLVALRGPSVRRIEVPIDGLHPDLEGLRIVQISDLHVGLTIRRRYVERVAAATNALAPDLIVLTGDIVDGSVEDLQTHVQPLATLDPRRTFYILGNHDCYSGAPQWIAHFESMGMHVLLNSNVTIVKGRARVLVGGVVDPAAAYTSLRLEPRADLAAAGGTADAFRLLLAHNPKLAPLGAQAGFDLQLSGHTHAGQFFPWTLVVRLVHTEHVAGLSREGRMWVYVSAGTGSWGPPVRFGTRPELTEIRLVRV